MATARTEVLNAFQRLEIRSGERAFPLKVIVDEVLAHTSDYTELTIRTYVTSVMCKEAPVHHMNHTDDLTRVGRGIYALADTPTDAVGDALQQSSNSSQRRRPDKDVQPSESEPVSASWFWEGNVQSAIVTGLAATGWQILAVSHTASRAAGTDIVASRHGRTIHVEVKGYPSTTYARGDLAGQPKPTHPATQARVWFAGALLKAAMMRGDHPDDMVAIGFPRFETYGTLAARVAVTLRNSNISLIWVEPNGAVDMGSLA